MNKKSLILGLMLMMGVVHAQGCPDVFPIFFNLYSDVSINCYWNNINYTCLVFEGETQIANLSMNVNCTGYVFESKQNLTEFFEVKNAQWEVGDDAGYVQYNISMRAVQPNKIDIVGDDVIEGLSFYLGSNATISLHYKIGAFQNYTNRPLTITYKGINHTIYYNLSLKDIQLPRINNVVYPLTIEAGRVYTMFLDVYDDWGIKEAKLTGYGVQDIIEEKTECHTNEDGNLVCITYKFNQTNTSNISSQTFIKITSGRYYLDRKEQRYGRLNYTVEVTDNGGNIVKREITLDVIPKDFITVKSVNIPALAINMPYETNIFEFDESVLLKVRVKSLKWDVKIPLPHENLTNYTTTNETSPNPPRVLLRVG